MEDRYCEPRLKQGRSCGLPHTRQRSITGEGANMRPKLAPRGMAIEEVEHPARIWKVRFGMHHLLVIGLAVKRDVTAQMMGDLAERDRVAGSHLDEARSVVMSGDPSANELERSERIATLRRRKHRPAVKHVDEDALRQRRSVHGTEPEDQRRGPCTDRLGRRLVATINGIELTARRDTRDLDETAERPAVEEIGRLLRGLDEVGLRVVLCPEPTRRHRRVDDHVVRAAPGLRVIGSPDGHGLDAGVRTEGAYYGVTDEASRTNDCHGNHFFAGSRT